MTALQRYDGGGACIVRPPAFPGLELAVPYDAAAGIETLVEHALDATVVGVDLPAPGGLSVDTVFGPSYSRLIKTGLDDAGSRAVARWGGAVFFISTQLASAREQMTWHSGSEKRAAEQRKAKDAADMRIASRLAGQWGGQDGAKQLWENVHARNSEAAPKPEPRPLLRLAVATLEGRLDYLLSTGGAASRSAIGLAALLDGRGWSELSALVKAWVPVGKIDWLAHDAVRGLLVEPPKLGFDGPVRQALPST